MYKFDIDYIYIDKKINKQRICLFPKSAESRGYPSYSAAQACSISWVTRFSRPQMASRGQKQKDLEGHRRISRSPSLPVESLPGSRILAKALLQGSLGQAMMAAEEGGPAGKFQGTEGRPQAPDIQAQEIKQRGQAHLESRVSLWRSGYLHLSRRRRLLYVPGPFPAPVFLGLTLSSILIEHFILSP